MSFLEVDYFRDMKLPKIAENVESCLFARVTHKDLDLKFGTDHYFDRFTQRTVYNTNICSIIAEMKTDGYKDIIIQPNLELFHSDLKIHPLKKCYEFSFNHSIATLQYFSDKGNLKFDVKPSLNIFKHVVSALLRFDNSPSTSDSERINKPPLEIMLKTDINNVGLRASVGKDRISLGTRYGNDYNMIGVMLNTHLTESQSTNVLPFLKSPSLESFVRLGRSNGVLDMYAKFENLENSSMSVKLSKSIISRNSENNFTLWFERCLFKGESKSNNEPQGNFNYGLALSHNADKYSCALKALCDGTIGISASSVTSFGKIFFDAVKRIHSKKPSISIGFDFHI